MRALAGDFFHSPEFIGTSVVVLAVPFCPGLRELEVLPRGSIRIASLLSRVEVPPGILLSPPSSSSSSSSAAHSSFIPASSRVAVLCRKMHASLAPCFPRDSTRITFLDVAAFQQPFFFLSRPCQRVEGFSCRRFSTPRSLLHLVPRSFLSDAIHFTRADIWSPSPSRSVDGLSSCRPRYDPKLSVVVGKSKRIKCSYKMLAIYKRDSLLIVSVRFELSLTHPPPTATLVPGSARG